MAWAPFSSTGPGGGLCLEELMHFRRWSLFLPQEANTDAERSAVYVKSRQAGNPKFFEQMRERLQSTRQDHGLLQAAGAEVSDEGDLAEALHLVLQAQWTAHGFHRGREFHKVLSLAKPCVEIVDGLCGARPELLFWRLLVRANLGHAYVEFKKFDEARDVLYQAVDLAEQHRPQGAAEQVVLGACFSHLAAVEWAAGSVVEASRCADMQLEIFERFLVELVEGPDEQEIQAAVLATAYTFRGACDDRQERYAGALAWYARARDSVEKYTGHNKDAMQISTLVADRMEQASKAAHLQGIRTEYAATGGPLPV
eukprot:CAMPEP_0179075304 /NCGR_PEP_ID=MMETSP0796-20121207/33525_1 /TAXON_ID=73915 /ORGANISM="Pyrodinium bahamense, Strain pbaha01" /LENGTH=311 /DNA_ID=CAMNT_0020772539 /DNA_START=54 /DNA_END=989 /DNA_ORIENTATION=-